MNLTEVIFAIIAVACSSTGQLCFKSASGRLLFRRAAPFWSLGIGLMLSSILLSVKILQSAPLSSFVPFGALAYIFVPVGAMVVFKEHMLPRFWLGVGLIVVGVALTLMR